MCGVRSQPTFSTSSWIVSRDSPTRASIRRRSTRCSPKTDACSVSPFGPEDALVPLPALAVAGEPRRPVREAAVQREVLGLLRRVVVLLGRVRRHEERVVDPAGRQQAAAPVSQEAEVPPTRSTTAPRSRPRSPRRAPCPPSSQRPMSNARSTSTSNANPVPVRNSSTRTPALGSVPELDEPHAGDLPEPADAPEQLPAPPVPAVELSHPPPPRRARPRIRSRGSRSRNLPSSPSPTRSCRPTQALPASVLQSLCGQTHRRDRDGVDRAHRSRTIGALVLLMMLVAPAEPSAAGTSDRRSVPVLMYHVVAEAPPDAPYPALHVGRLEFAAQMHWLARRGFVAVTLKQVYEAVARPRNAPASTDRHLVRRRVPKPVHRCPAAVAPVWGGPLSSTATSRMSEPPVSCGPQW